MLPREKNGERESNSLVDIGCGDSRFTREISQRTGVHRILGIDTTERIIRLARAMDHNVKGIEFTNSNIMDRPVTGEYDAADLMEVLEHVPASRVDEFLTAVRAMLKPGGRLFLTVPHKNKPVEPKHFQHFDVDSLSRCLQASFEIFEVVPFERRGLRRRLMEKLLCNRLYVMNNQRLLNRVYAWHGKRLFHCSSERDCQRIFVEAIARPGT